MRGVIVELPDWNGRGVDAILGGVIGGRAESAPKIRYTMTR